jgi:hypothetical protein
MDFMLYPTFGFNTLEEQWFANVYLPLNYKRLVKKFYTQGRKENIIKYARLVEEKLIGKKLEIRLLWENKLGLTNIDIGLQGGLDLVEEGFPHFCGHNLGTNTSIACGMITMKYVSELLKSNTR